MPHEPQSQDPLQWQRYFAMTSNNRAWQLAVQQRSAIEDAEMLNCAHAAAWHWSEVGTELHVRRAELLLAEVHALLGGGESAWGYAESAKAYLLANNPPDWELAYVHVIHAHAAAVAGHSAAHQTSYALATDTVAAIADPQDRELVLQTFHCVAVP